MILTELVAESPDAELEELRGQMKKKTKVEISISTISRALKALGLSRKKNEARERGRSGQKSRVREKAKKIAR